MKHAAKTRENRTYLAWANMHARCRDKHQAKWYAGVSVCLRWSDFNLFLADVGPRPSDHHSLDRIDPAGNYEPDNVRWATRTTQARNCRVTPKTVSGVRGVTWSNRENKWQARISVGHKRISLGYFFNLDDAKLARLEGEIKHWRTP